MTISNLTLSADLYRLNEPPIVTGSLLFERVFAADDEPMIRISVLVGKEKTFFSDIPAQDLVGCLAIFA